MRQYKHVRVIIAAASKRITLQNEESNQYLDYRVYRRATITSVKAKKEMNNTIENIESLMSKLRSYLKRIKTSDENTKLKSVNDFTKDLTHLSNTIIVIMRKFAKSLSK